MPHARPAESNTPGTGLSPRSPPHAKMTRAPVWGRSGFHQVSCDLGSAITSLRTPQQMWGSDSKEGVWQSIESNAPGGQRKVRGLKGNDKWLSQQDGENFTGPQRALQKVETKREKDVSTVPLAQSHWTDQDSFVAEEVKIHFPSCQSNTHDPPQLLLFQL